MTVTVQNTFVDSSGSPVAGLTVRIQLVTATTGAQPGYTATQSVGPPTIVVTNSAGFWSARLLPNSTITEPTGTYYQVLEGNYPSLIQVPANGGPYQLSSLLVSTPPAPTTTYIPASQKAAAGGVASLDNTGNVPADELGNVPASMVAVAEGGTVAGTRHEVNFVPGTNVTISAVDNPGAGRVDVTVSASGAISANSLPTLPMFNVEDYGAVGNGTTNDGPAILAAWNALLSSNANGYLMFPRRATYRVDVTSMITHGTGDQYAAFPIPIIPHDTNTPMRVLGIVGPGPALVGRQFGNGSPVAPPQGTAIIKVTYNTPFTWSTSHGLPSLFGGPDYDFAAQGNTNVHFLLNNIQVRQPDPPSICNFNLETCQCVTVDEYFCDSDVAPDSAAKPIHVTGAAILLPAPGNAAVVTVGRIGCWGYFAGIPFAEHLGAQYVFSLRNWIGLPIRRGADHFAQMNMTVLEENRFIICGYDPSTTTGAVACPGSTATGGQMVINIGCFDFEDFPNGADTWTYTRTHGAHVYDPNNALRGVIWEAGINSGSTAPTGRTADMLAVGGTSLVCYSLLDGNRVTLTQSGYAPVDPTSTTPGAPTIGAATSPSSASASVAFTPPAATGGAPILSYTATSSPGGITGSGSSSPVTVGGLTNGTPYTFTVMATNANGSGSASAASNSVTPQAQQQNLFTTQTPSTTNANDAHPYTLGTLFISSNSGQVLGLRWYFPSVLPSQPVIAVLFSYDSEVSGTELARKTFSNPTTGAWNSVTFDTPVNITANTKYVAAVWTADRYVATNGFFSSAGLTNGSLTSPRNDTSTPISNGRFDVGNSASGPAYPATAAAGACYFPDPTFLG